MTSTGYTTQELIEGFGFKTEQQLNKYLTYGKMQPGETYNDFSVRMFGCTLDEQIFKRKKLTKLKNKANKKLDQYKIYITKISPINPSLKKIVLNKIRKKLLY